MSDLMRYAAALEDMTGRAAAPVERWNPEFCGDINLVIKSDGVWFYEGTPIGRARLVHLFSTVLKREGDDYFLVTPAEKLGITVEDAPFVAVLMRQEETSNGQQRLVFTSNVGEEVVAGPDHPISFREVAESGPRAPYIEVRAGLEARVARAVYYDLVALGETRQIDGVELFGVASEGVFFPFEAAHVMRDGDEQGLDNDGERIDDPKA
ncbi:MAG: DUF1285 domain-containing protein [Pseudomonadota bacterium]